MPRSTNPTVEANIEAAKSALANGGLIVPTTESASAVMLPAPAGVPSTLNWADLVQGADHVAGATLEKSKANLIGVPFVITSATWRDGVPNKDKTPSNYVSVEIVTADADTLNRYIQMGRVPANVYQNVNPNEALVLNDGSAGIARQVTAYAHSKGLIEVPAGPESGEAGSSRYDAHRSLWIRGNNPDGSDVRIEFRLVCMRGLRVSEYTNDFGDAETYYIG